MSKPAYHRPSRAIRQATEAIKNLEALVTEAQKGNLAARNKVILLWRPWIEAQARLYAQRAGRLDLIEDMQQVAVCGEGRSVGGLMRAIETYDSNRGAAFHTHAIWHVNATFMEMLARNVPGKSKDGFKQDERIRSIARTIFQHFGRNATVEDIRRAASDMINRKSDSQIEDALSNVVEPLENKCLSAAYDSHHYGALVQDSTQEAIVHARQVINRLWKTLEAAPEVDRIVFTEHVFNGVPLSRLGRKFGLERSAMQNTIQALIATVSSL